jgi:F0F1-type ATP synthase membrane subunit b/b'
MSTPIDRALDKINQRDTRIRNQIASINRLLSEWRDLQDWVSEQIQGTDEDDESQRMRAGAFSEVLDKMADIRVKDAQGG